jgi:hypothetical protein
LNTAPDTAGNARGLGENCESQSELNLIRTAMAMALDPAMAMGTTTGTGTANAMDLELASAPESPALATAMATATATVTAIDSEQAAALPPEKAFNSNTAPDLNMALDSASDTAPIQPLALATAMATVTAMDSKQIVDMVLTPSQALASQSDDDGSHFSLVEDGSSEEFEWTGDDDVTKEEKK